MAQVAKGSAMRSLVGKATCYHIACAYPGRSDVAVKLVDILVGASVSDMIGAKRTAQMLAYSVHSKHPNKRPMVYS